MSSLFSDPPFQRGSTLLGGEAIEYVQVGATYNQSHATSTPVAGNEIVGQVKAFLDIHPVTKVRLSNELVYCIAARYKPSGTTSLNATSGADRGKAVELRLATSGLGSTAEFTGTLANSADVVAGARVGFIDEYLFTEIRPNDIIWVTFKGPAIVKKKTGAALNSGTLVSLEGSAATAGDVVTKADISIVTTSTSERVALGQAIGSVNTSTNEIVLGANAVSADEYVRAILYGVNWQI
jgi:hypothetical protein